MNLVPPSTPVWRSWLALCLMLATDGRSADYDLILRGGQLVDGSGSPARSGDVAIKSGHIMAVGEVTGTAEEILEVGGKVIAPGFIDVHTHSEKITDLPVAENFLRMGVTTLVTGNCGNSRTDVGAFFSEIEKVGTTLNVATLIGHGSVREEGMGGTFIRAPDATQLEAMKRRVRQAMEEGAVGMSTGLIYVPGSFAKTDEIIALAQVVAEFDGIYASHMRSESAQIFTALEELIEITRKAQVRTQLSHIKLSGPSAWGKAGDVLARLDQARAEGLRITQDQYGYTASSTGLRQLIPDQALEGTRADFEARLADPERKQEILRGMKNILTRSGRQDYRYAVIARFAANPRLNGLAIPEAAKRLRGDDSVEAQMELLLDIEKQGGGSGIFHGMNEEDLRVFMKHPLTMIASDGGPRRFGEDVPHPRSYGNNVRVLARYVREQSLLSLEEAVRHMTSLPADTFQFKDRGRLQVGAVADVVVFHPDAIKDPSTYDDPHHYAEGVSDVLVRGIPVIRDHQLTAARPGGPLRRRVSAKP